MIPVVLSPETCYATKSNICHPGSAAQVTAAETAADLRIQQALDSQGLDGLDITVSSGAIERAIG
jgi:hypothetical protein